MTEGIEIDRPTKTSPPVDQAEKSRVNVGPFGRAAFRYRGRGWPGVLPMQAGEDGKRLQVSGYTGHSGGWPKASRVDEWVRRYSDRNIALRATPGTVALDVDAYEGKAGGQTLAKLEAEHGPLPDTWRSSSRSDDATSGIRWFQAELPEGRRWRNEAGPGIELVHPGHRYALVWPSVHPKTGERYHWYPPRGERAICPRPEQLPKLSDAWVEALTRPEVAPAAEGASERDPKFTEGQSGTKYGRLALANELFRLKGVWERDVEAFNPVLNRVAFAVGQLVGGGELEAGHARARLEDALTELGAPADQYPTLDSGWRAGLAKPRSASPRPEPQQRDVPESPPVVAGPGSPEVDQPKPEPKPVISEQEGPELNNNDDLAVLRGELLVALRKYQDLPDPAHVWTAIAAAVTKDSDEDPLWLMLVAPPSSGKTEAVNLLNVVTSQRLDSITVAGLLGWVKRESEGPKGKKKNELTPGGALISLPRWPGKFGARRGLLTFGDLSTLLATSDRGGRDEVFAFLRRVYDGHATRNIAQPGGESNGEPLVWDGRATVVAACTKAIDNYSAHADALGPRWVYYRLPERDTAAKRKAARMARTPGISDLRATALGLATRLIKLASTRLDETKLSEGMYDTIEDAALVTCWGRGAVPRSGYGTREVLGMPDVEEPPRLIRQLTMLATGLLALGLPEALTAQLVRKCALDSMPETRAKVLLALADADQPLSTVALAKAADMARGTARRNAEDLELIGVVHSDRTGSAPEGENEPDKRPCLWSLRGDDGDLIRQVIEQALGEGWA